MAENKYSKHIGVYNSEDDFIGDEAMTAPWIACIESPNGPEGTSEYTIKYSSTPITGNESANELMAAVEEVRQEKVYLKQSEYDAILANPTQSLPATAPDGTVIHIVYNDNKDKLYFTYEG